MKRIESISIAKLSLFTLLLCVQLHGGCGRPAATNGELRSLQGSWESDGSSSKVAITITGDSLLFFQRPDFWFQTTFELSSGTEPRQLHATITDSATPGDDIGEVVLAIYELEDGMLTLATDGGSDAPETFDDADSRYKLRKVQPAEGN